MDLLEIGEAIREARQSEGLTLEELGEQTGLSTVTLSGLENGKASNIGLSNLSRVCRRVGLEVTVARAEHRPRAGRVAP